MHTYTMHSMQIFYMHIITCYICFVCTLPLIFKIAYHYTTIVTVYSRHTTHMMQNDFLRVSGDVRNGIILYYTSTVAVYRIHSMQIFSMHKITLCVLLFYLK